jgi:hypothetical protein
MNDARPARGGCLAISLLTVAWISGTIVFLFAAYAESFCLGCEVSEQHRLAADRLALGSVACACVFPLLAALICVSTHRRLGAVIFVILGLSLALGYGLTVGIGAARDIHRSQLPTSVPVPPNYCPCYSGGSCDCPGG